MKKFLQYAAAALILATVVSIPVAHAALMGGGGVDTTFLNTLYCKLSGCSMTGALVLDGVATSPPLSIRDSTPGKWASFGSAGTEQIGLYANGQGVATLNVSTCDPTNGCAAFNGVVTLTSGLVMTPSGAGTALIKATGFNGSLRVGANGGVGSSVDENATTLTGYFGDGMSAGSGGNVLFGIYGSGLGATNTVQAPAACSTSTSIDPQSSVIVMDSGAADCTLTINTTTASTINLEGLTVRVTAKNVGAGHLKIASTNFASIPARCSSTGLALGQSALIAWSKDQAKWTFLGGCE